MSLAEVISPLVGRWAIAWFFLSEVWARAHNWYGNVDLLSMAHVPVPQAALFLALIVMTFGGLALLLGWHVRHGAMLLFGFTVVATVLLHDFWHIKAALERAADYEIFARNVAVAGGLLLLVGMGGGPLSLDNRGKG
ncbi:MAG: DoxX family protein [Proteobacteria bacterium]|nr:DoxX family protein [Pseudomonadota bacterium]